MLITTSQGGSDIFKLLLICIKSLHLSNWRVLTFLFEKSLNIELIGTTAGNYFSFDGLIEPSSFLASIYPNDKRMMVWCACCWYTTTVRTVIYIFWGVSGSQTYSAVQVVTCWNRWLVEFGDRVWQCDFRPLRLIEEFTSFVSQLSSLTYDRSNSTAF